MPRFLKQVLFLRHLNGLLNHRLKHRLCRSSADNDDDSIEEAKDVALASIIKHCKGKHYLFRSAKNRKGQANRFSDDLPPIETLIGMVNTWRIPTEISHVQSGFQLGSCPDRRLRRIHDSWQHQRRTSPSTGCPSIDGLLEVHWHWRCWI